MAVFHLKYRPKKIDELDVESAAKTLKKVLKEKDRPQSFLFTGPKGAGKTSAARIVAQAVNCLDPDGIEPCGKCKNCLEIGNGRSMDILEIDAASNRGIDEVRELKDKVFLLPTNLKMKVFIIDEVHMMTKEAFNALLKLIEEPPKHTMFILCTTDPEKIPETVVSRLFRVDFAKGKREELNRALQKIVKGEKIKISDEAVEMILAASDGSFRNLHRMFNEIVMNLGKEIEAAEVNKYFSQREGNYTAEELEKDLEKGEAKTILRKLEEMAKIGGDFKNFREKLILYFQNKLLVNFGVGEGQSKMGVEALKKWLGLLIAAGRQEKEVEIGQLPLELAVVEFLGESKLPPVSKKNEEVKITMAGVCDLGRIEKEWGRVLSAVKPFNHSVEAFLRAVRPKKIEGKQLLVEVFYPFHKERLEENKNRAIVEKGLLQVFGTEIAFGCVLSKDKKEPLVIKNDTPIEKVSEELAKEEKKEKDLYEVTKEIFG